MSLLVIGAGVSGLSSAILLAEAGHPVRIWARDLPPHTTSNKAAAIWYPYLCYPRAKALVWAGYSYQYFAEHLIPQPDSGVSFQTMTEIFVAPQPDPWWLAAMPAPVERPAASELPPGYVDGYRFQGILIESGRYLEFLLGRAADLGISVEQRDLSSFDEAFAAAEVVVNCSGLGARQLAADESLHPVRGQMLRVKPAGFTETIFDDSGPNSLGLVVPRSGDMILGGTTQEDDWNLDPDPADADAILRKARAILPDLAEIEVLEHVVGLRPVRPEVRVEAERVEGGTLVHNYGHGGAGFTLSWGCARDVVDLVNGNL